MIAGQSPVLIVGGRTTGLMIAAKLAQHGVPIRVNDCSLCSGDVLAKLRTRETAQVLGAPRQEPVTSEPGSTV